MEHQHPGAVKALTVKGYRLFRQKMERDAVAPESIHDQQVITRRFIFFQRETGVSDQKIDLVAESRKYVKCRLAIVYMSGSSS